jgi:hypothetical protein
MGPTTTEALHLAASNWLGFHRSPQSDFNSTPVPVPQPPRRPSRPRPPPVVGLFVSSPGLSASTVHPIHSLRSPGVSVGRVKPQVRIGAGYFRTYTDPLGPSRSPHRPRQPGCQATLSVYGPGRVHRSPNCSRRFRSPRIPPHLRPVPYVLPTRPRRYRNSTTTGDPPQRGISTMNEIRPLPASIYRRLRSGQPEIGLPPASRNEDIL